eukprot:205429_1
MNTNGISTHHPAEPHGTKPSSVLLRDKILLYDRFALDLEKLESYKLDDSNISQTTRVAEKTDSIFPGWDEVPLPRISSARTYSSLKEQTTESHRRFLPPSHPANSLPASLPIVVDISPKAENVDLKGIRPPAVGFSEGSKGSNKLQFHLKNLEAVEDSLEKLLHSALEENTHNLTTQFQKTMQKQFLSFNYKNRKLARDLKRQMAVSLTEQQLKMDKFTKKYYFLKSENERLKRYEQLNALMSDEIDRHKTEKSKLAAALESLKRAHSDKLAEVKRAHRREVQNILSSIPKIVSRGPSPVKRSPTPRPPSAAGGVDNAVVQQLEDELRKAQRDAENLQKSLRSAERSAKETGKKLRGEITKLKSSLEENDLKHIDETMDLKTQILNLEGEVRVGKRIAEQQAKDAKRIVRLSRELEEIIAKYEESSERAKNAEALVDKLQEDHGKELSLFQESAASGFKTIRGNLGILQDLMKQIHSVDERLAPDLTCKHCMDVLKDPSILTCGHSFCKKCLEESRSEGTGDFFCSECDDVCSNCSVIVSNVSLEGVVCRYNFWASQLHEIRVIFTRSMDEMHKIDAESEEMKRRMSKMSEDRAIRSTQVDVTVMSPVRLNQLSEASVTHLSDGSTENTNSGSSVGLADQPQLSLSSPPSSGSGARQKPKKKKAKK